MDQVKMFRLLYYHIINGLNNPNTYNENSLYHDPIDMGNQGKLHESSGSAVHECPTEA